MRAHEFLIEYNEQQLVNDFGAKLVARTKEDITAPKKKTAKQLVQLIAKMDPTPNKELAFWLALNYARYDEARATGQGIARWEDIGGRAVTALQRFKALLNKPNLTPPLPVRDINQIRGLSALEDLVEKYPDKETQSNQAQATAEEENLYKTGKAVLLHNDNQVKVVELKSEAAAVFFGKGTRWCTAATNNNRYTIYAKQGPLYVVIIKGTNEKYQFHWPTNQFMDAQDKEINLIELANKYPVLWDVFDPIAKKNNSIILQKNPSEADQVAAVKEDDWAIQYIKNPSEAVKLAAVQKNGLAIQFIKNPSEAVQLAAVQKNGLAIQFIKNPCPAAIQLAKNLGVKV